MGAVRFHGIVECLRPLMMGDRRLGCFVAALVDMGLGSPGVSALELRSESTWKSLGNGSRRLSARLASELVSRWDVVVFGENLVGAYGEDALIDVAECVRALDPRVSKADVGEGIGRVLYEVFKRAAEEAAGRSAMGEGAHED